MVLNFSLLDNHVEPPGTPKQNLRVQRRAVDKKKKNIRVKNMISFYVMAGPKRGRSKKGVIVNTSNFRLPAYSKNNHFRVMVVPSGEHVIVPRSLIKRVVR